MFQYFSRFLEQLAVVQPAIALAYIDRKDAGLATFLAPLLCGLERAGKEEAVRLLTARWIHDGTILEQILRYCAVSAKLDLPLLEEATAKVIELGQDFGVFIAVEASVRWSGEGTERVVEEVFLPAIRYLTDKKKFQWVRTLWPLKEGRELLKVLTPAQDDALLALMVSMPDIDHYAEEILKAIGSRDMAKIFNFFERRLDYENQSDYRRYDPIPYKFHELDSVLRNNPDLLVAKALDWHRATPKLFGLRGGRIIAATFSTPDKELLGVLTDVVTKGELEEYQFVLQVLENYKGEIALHPLLKEIVAAVPNDSDLLSGIMVALDATGTMTGEFGVVETQVRKRDEIMPWLDDPRERVKMFATKRIAALERQFTDEQRRAEQSLELRKLDYGE